MATKGRVRKTVRINGRRVSQTFRTKELAERWYRKMVDQRDAIRAGLDLEMQAVPLTLYAKKFIRRRRDGNFGTWVNDEGRMRNHVLPYVPKDQATPFGDRAISSIGVSEWEGLLTDLVARGKSRATANRVRALISKLYNEAMREKPQVAQSNPIELIKPYDERRARIKKIKANFWPEREDMQKYLKAALEEAPGYLAYQMITFNTGLRTSQKVPLKWADYDESQRVITVSRSYLPSNNTIREGSKGFAPGEDYVVGVNDVLGRFLAWWHARTLYRAPEDFICSRENGEHFKSWHLRKAHKRLIKRAGVNYISPHGLRHTYATHYIDAGGTTENLQKMLGHKNITTTQIYSHVIPKTMKDKANVLSVEVPFAETLSLECHRGPDTVSEPQMRSERSTADLLGKTWGDRGDLNPRPSESQSSGSLRRQTKKPRIGARKPSKSRKK